MTNRFNKTIESELRDLLYNLARSDRKDFHIYTIHRVMSLSLLSDYSFRYDKNECGDIVIEIDFGSNGVVRFLLDGYSGYAKIDSKESMNNLNLTIHYLDRKREGANPKDSIF